MKLLSFFLFIILFYLNETKLYQTFLFFRHGARYHTNTLYDGNSTFPVRGELTAIGMRMQQNLGKIIRKQYIQKIPLLSDKYNASEIQLYSTRYDRTIQSAVSFIYGLYPSGNGPRLPYVDRPYHLPPYSNKTDSDQQNYALPNAHQINSVNFDDKVILKDCLNWDQLINKSITYRKPQYDEMTLTYTPFLKKLTSIFYKNQTQSIKIDQTIDVYDTLHVDKYLSRPLPANITQADYKNLEHLNSWYYAFTCSNNLSHLINTNKFKKIVNEFENRVRLMDNYAKKMTIMSVHDTDIASLLNDLNLTSSQCIQELYRKGQTQAINCQTNVGFASNLIIQLHSDDGLGFYVKVRNDGKYMKLCEKQDTKCSYIEWRARIKNVILNNVEEICKH